MIICPDDHLINDAGLYEWSVERVTQAWRTSESQLDAALMNPRLSQLVLVVGLPGAGKTTTLAKLGASDHEAVFFDAAALCRRSSRADYIKKATRFGWKVSALVIDTPPQTCLERNLARPDNRRVPEVSMTRWAAALAACPPSKDEGLAEIVVVKGT